MPADRRVSINGSAIRPTTANQSIGWLLVTRVAGLATVVGLSLYVFFQILPLALPMSAAERAEIRFPPVELDDVRRLLRLLERQSENRAGVVLALYSFAYLIKQAFAIPGSGLMNLLGGALYGQWWGCVLVTSLTAAGSTLCYALSWLFGRELVQHFLRARVERFRRRIAQERGSDLFMYLVLLRWIPFTPNWFLNIAAPHVHISTGAFAASVFLGLIPYNFLTVGAGNLLHEIHTMADILRPATLAKLLLMAAMLLALIMVRRRYEKTRKAKPI